MILLGAKGPLTVEVFKMEVEEEVDGVRLKRTYYLVQNELFAARERSGIYSFEDEDEMLTWLAVFNQAVAAVVVQEGFQHLQLHDYHGGLSLMYIPENLRPAVLYVAHNAHYNAAFPIPTSARREQVHSLNHQGCAQHVVSLQLCVLASMLWNLWDKVHSWQRRK